MGLPKLGWLKMLKNIRSRLKRKPLRESDLPPQRQIDCVAPNPRRTLRPRSPCRGVAGTMNTAGLILFPPATFGFAIRVVLQEPEPFCRCRVEELPR